MPYCFMKYRPAPDGEGQSPDFPASVSFMLLADAAESDWGLWHYVDEERNAWEPEHPVGEALAALIESGKRYPPALALARAETKQVCSGQSPSPEDLERAHSAALQHYLSQQHEARYVMAKALEGEGTDLCAGEWYWIVAADSSTVSWVSDDFFIYRSPMSAFDLTGAQLRQLG